MSIQDVLKKSFLNQFNSDLSTTSIVGTLILTALIGTYIFVIYRAVCRKAFYSKSFAISLPVISMITASIIISIQSSVVISLGMVGALSIVRFRTAVKDPMDLAFLFWTISVGIICGAGLFEVAVEASILITIVMLLLHFVPNVKPALLLLVNGTDSKIQAELEQVKRELQAYKDTGLEPEDFKRAFNDDAVLKLAGQVLGVKPDRLRELAQADREGRCVVLPAKPDQTIYQWRIGDDCPSVSRLDGVQINADGEITYPIWNGYLTPGDFGETVFLTREEAALRREQDGE